MATAHSSAAADVLAADPPSVAADRAADIARTVFGVSGMATPLVSERDQNVVIRGSEAEAWVLKISNPAEDAAVVAMEVAAVERIAAVDPALPVPLAVPALDGRPIATVDVDGVPHVVRLLPLLPGHNPRPEDLPPNRVRQIGEVVARIGFALRAFFHPAAGRAIAWDQQRLPTLFRHVELIPAGARRTLLEGVLDRFRARVMPALPTLRAQVIHNDVTLDNLLVDDAGAVTGIIDFGDMAHTALVLDVPATLQSLFRGRADELFERAEVFLEGYTSVVPLERREAELLGDLLAGRMAQTILISVERTRRYPDNAYIQGWAEPAWALLEELERIGPDVASRRLASAALRPAAPRPSRPVPDPELIRRRSVLGSALEPLTYRRPLHLVRGFGAWLEDADGRRYLDAYNNVPVVGHAHPRVVEALARQAATLNTNTRYLHEHVIELAERLVASMPAGLDTVMFVNSGSEANDLAWRLATTGTGGGTGIVTDWAYHGVTAAIAPFSPSEWPRGEQPAGVETVRAPDTFRGPYAESGDPAAVARDEVNAAVGRARSHGDEVAALYLDAGFTADGIFVPSPDVVRAFVAGARGSGALYVADEVQAGFGRTGDDFWGFAAWDVVPDVVTLGKPMGNGHPVAGVVTRADIVDRLAAETTFFSTFGGNPVACAAALAVLDVIEEEELVANAAARGAWLRTAIQEVAGRHAVVADVRGRGLLVGVQLDSPDGAVPAREVAGRVKDELRERGVLIGTTGRDGATLKIRPPLCLTAGEAELLVTRLDEVLGSIVA